MVFLPQAPLTYFLLRRRGASLTKPQEFERVNKSIDEKFNEKTPAQRKDEMQASRRAKQNALQEREGLPLLPPIEPKPAAEKPAAEKPAAKKPAAKKPAAEKPAAEEPVKPKTKPQLVEVVERKGWKSGFGFMVFRTDYKDEGAWGKFDDMFKKLVDESIAAEIQGAEEKAWVKKSLLFHIVIDEQMVDAPLEDVAR